VCRTTYVYRVTATQPGGEVSVSNPFSILTTSAVAPPAPQLVASFDLQNIVELRPFLPTGNLPTDGRLRYRRTLGSAPATDLGNPVASTFIKRDSATLADLLANAPCYTVRFVDLCGNTSAESRPSCPSVLRAAPGDAEGLTATVSWTAFSGPDPGTPATYTLQRLAADGTVLGPPVSVGTGLSFTDANPPSDQPSLRYRVQVSGAGIPAGTFSYSNVATVPRVPRVQLPTAFTPNGDGLNDVLEVKGRFLGNYVFVVVDRNGQEVFRGTKRSDTWNGSIRGRAPVNGTYVWRFQQTNEDGKQTVQTGTVTIIN
jgi:gliding motility-associated-like protein